MIEIEQALIGSIILKENKYLDVSDILNADDFLSKQGKEAWLAIGGMYGARRVSLTSVYEVVSCKEWVVEASGKATPDVKGVGLQIAEASKKRRLVKKMMGIVDEIKNSTYHHSDYYMESIMRLYHEELGNEKLPCDISSVADRFEEKQQSYRDNGFGISTGFRHFDKDYITYRPGHIWVIGAWTSVGKTTYMVQALSNIMKKARCAVFSTEMVEEQNISKILACSTGFNSNVILSGRIDSSLRSAEKQSLNALRKTDLHIYDKIRTTAGIATQCRKLAMKKRLDVVFIDFIQNLDTETGQKYDAMSNAAIALQNLAHELRCTVVVLSQLPNSAGKMDSGILEFKGAGEIAAAADVGVLMKRSKEDKRVILFDIRKNRHGACDQYLFRYNDSWSGLIEEGKVDEAYN